MLGRRVLALILWCHCYQIVLNPFLQLLATSLYYSPFGFDRDGQNNIFLRHPEYLVTGTSIVVEANQVALTPGHEIVLRCNLTDYPNQEFTWYRIRHLPKYEREPPEKPREEMTPINDKYIINNNVLTLKSPNFGDVGDYFCRVKNPTSEMETEKMIMVRARPYILDFDLESSTYRSAMVEEGDSLKLVCNVIDDYNPDSKIRVSWTMSKFEENATDEVVPGEQGIEIEDFNSTSKALIIDSVTKDHRRFYKCHASNGITDNSKVILIRVKSKYLILFPGIGIIIELIVLLFVIFVVENRKVEPDKDIYDHKAAHM